MENNGDRLDFCRLSVRYCSDILQWQSISDHVLLAREV